MQRRVIPAFADFNILYIFKGGEPFPVKKLIDEKKCRLCQADKGNQLGRFRVVFVRLLPSLEKSPSVLINSENVNCQPWRGLSLNLTLSFSY